MHRRSWYNGLGDVETARKMGFASEAMAEVGQRVMVKWWRKWEWVRVNGSYGP
jgi:hypothetical protein